MSAERERESRLKDGILQHQRKRSDEATKAAIECDILSQLLTLLPRDTVDIGPDAWAEIATAIYEPNHHYNRRVANEITESGGDLFESLLIVSTFRHYRRLYQRQERLDRMHSFSLEVDLLQPPFSVTGLEGYLEPLANSSVYYQASQQPNTPSIRSIPESLLPLPPRIDPGMAMANCPVCLEVCPSTTFQATHGRTYSRSRIALELSNQVVLEHI